MAHCSEVLKNDPGVEERTKGTLKTRSGAQADNMEIFEQDTKLA
jgi:hypothetical protein